MQELDINARLHDGLLPPGALSRLPGALHSLDTVRLSFTRLDGLCASLADHLGGSLRELSILVRVGGDGWRGAWACIASSTTCV